MRIGVYNRYWNTRGGGERYAGALAEALSGRFEVDLIGVEPVDFDALAEHLGLELSAVGTRQGPEREEELEPLTADYDLFVNAAFASRLRCRAPRAAYVVLFPHRILSPPRARRLRSLRPLPGRLARRLERFVAARSPDFLADYDALLAISKYAQGWIARRWDRSSDLLPPPTDTRLFRAPAAGDKERVILAVGRFFRGAHNKKHLRLVRTFRRMCDRRELPAGWELHLAGNLHRTDLVHYEYYAQVKSLARGYPVRLLPDLSLDELRDEYRRASIFWHAAGWGESERRHPEKLEHFGMATCEAMSAGCIPVVIAKAGQLEIVRDGLSGFLFRSERQLVERTLRLVRGHGEGWREEMMRECVAAARHYDRAAFERRLFAILERRRLIG